MLNGATLKLRATYFKSIELIYANKCYSLRATMCDQVIAKLCEKSSAFGHILPPHYIVDHKDSSIYPSDMRTFRGHLKGQN